jgi:hypothetical protein
MQSLDGSGRAELCLGHPKEGKLPFAGMNFEQLFGGAGVCIDRDISRMRSVL